jgi:CubicO group peptidase (beta-lactamase class C family)
VKQAIADGKLSWDDINEKVKKVLLVKYNLGLNHLNKIDTTNLLNDLNKKTNHIKELLAKNAISLLKRSSTSLLPLSAKKVAYLGIGIDKSNEFATRLLLDFKADVLLFSIKDSSTKIDSLMQVLATYDAVVIGLHNYSRRPANNFGLSDNTIDLLKKVQQFNCINFVFGNPYALKYLCNAKNLVACYEDDLITQDAAADLLKGKYDAKGKLPVTVCEELKVGDGIVYNQFLPDTNPAAVGLNEDILKKIDSIAYNGIAKAAMPGCVVLVAKDGKIAYNKAFGFTNFDNKESINKDMIYDLASVTKVSATTVSIMKLYEEGKIDLQKTLGDYLPWVKGSDKSPIKLKDILLHQAGLNPFIPFYRDVIDTVTGIPNPAYFSKVKDATHQFRAAEDLYVRNDYEDSLYHRIVTSKLTPSGHYIYSDNDFIFLGKIVEAVSGVTLNEYARINFYEPLQMTTTGFKPRERFPLGNIVPTEEEKHFRQQLIRGDVHDEGAAMFGGVAGHAGLFSNAYDLAKLYQMLLNGGELNGIRLLKKETIDLFTAYNSEISRRGLGFDKPEKDNSTRKDPYPSASVSPETFGHTGFTGTCVWVDPKQKLIYIFLSNRVTPTRNNNKLSQMNIRPTIQEAVYQSILK